MAETLFWSLTADGKRDALVVAANRRERRAYLLKEDVWSIETLKICVETPFEYHLIFKDRTSLTRARRTIWRFPEDVNITCDICAFAPNLTGDAYEATTRSDARRSKRASMIVETTPTVSV